MNSEKGGGLGDLVGSAWKRNLAGNCRVPRGMGSKIDFWKIGSGAPKALYFKILREDQ